MSMPFTIVNEPTSADLLIIGDHAGNALPDDIDLGLSAQQMQSHIAWDPGVGAVARILCENKRNAAILGRYSRLLVDLNRPPHQNAVIPQMSDGIEITANHLEADERADRLRRFHQAYHAEIARTLDVARPKLMLNLHSFTPLLSSDPSINRPWAVGVLYNLSAAPSKRAIELLGEYDDWIIGDQLPYTGELFNATMDRHAETRLIPYIGIEMRQDLIANEAGQQKFASRIAKLCQNLIAELASGALI